MKNQTTFIAIFILSITNAANAQPGYEPQEDCTMDYVQHCGGNPNQTMLCFSEIDSTGFYTDKTIEIEDEISIDANSDCTIGGTLGFGSAISCAFEAFDTEANPNYHFEPKYNTSMTLSEQDIDRDDLGSSIFMREDSYVDSECSGGSSCAAVTKRWYSNLSMNCLQEKLYIAGFRIVLREHPRDNSGLPNGTWVNTNIHPTDFVNTWGPLNGFYARDIILHELGHAIATAHLNAVETMYPNRPNVSNYAASNTEGRLMPTPIYTRFIHDNLGFNPPGTGEDLAVNLGYTQNGTLLINAYINTKLTGCPGDIVEFPITVQNRGPTDTIFNSKLYISPSRSLLDPNAAHIVTTVPREIKRYSSDEQTYKIEIPKDALFDQSLYIIFSSYPSNNFSDW
ncbi:MAG: hypothetical protein AAFY41_13815, partial [Bacteroidota bacterium]